MKFKNVLLLYKRSAYKIYFTDRRSALGCLKRPVIRQERKRFKEAHDAHYTTLKHISKILLLNGIKYTECYRGSAVDYRKYDFIITVGGDGTFLEASHKITDQLIIGVNSAPNHSVGRYCIATDQNFEAIFKKILSRNAKVAKYQRLRVEFEENKIAVEALNDVLICHSNPAMLCRYYLKVGALKEEQRSSGVWVSTAAGSSGAIRSAGGKLLNPYAKQFQYKARELYQSNSEKYKLKDGILSSRQAVEVTSLMRRGAIYIDGAHNKFPFPYGEKLRISISPHPIRTIQV